MVDAKEDIQEPVLSEAAQAERQDKIDKVEEKVIISDAGVSAPLTKITAVTLQPDGGFLSMSVKGFMNEDKVVSNKAAFDENFSRQADMEHPAVVAYMAYVNQLLATPQ